jgi:hypothetical protein
MEQEDKELLLKDLCARLPYGVKIELMPIIKGKCTVLTPILLRDYFISDDVNYLPYLRPMSSMTEEECDKVEEILGNDCIFDFMGNGDIVLHKGNFTQKTLSKLYDFYNSIHVDYHTDDEGRTMIEKGLAIEVTEDNNPYKE